ncbi:MAG: NAD-dependent succinate-semialdehyde dehydrogenase [Hyphomicrobiales bacterium]|nr:MAG: NAD-dependent succinate-semialdehyde dehydrogenase [Hyphomicrobiales bacterium]
MSYVSTNPATGETLEVFESATDTEIADSLGRADAAYQAWRGVEITERATVVSRVAKLYRERADELAVAVSLEMGKPVSEALYEVSVVADIYDYYASEGPAFAADETLTVRSGGEAIVRHEPLGVLLGIMPWNFPYYQVARFVAPNLILGNTIVLKHAENCPRIARIIEDIFRDAGLPDGTYVNVFASKEQVATMIADRRVQGVSLTGSERAGTAVAEVAARNLKKCVLELGGSDPFIVLDGESLDATVDAAVTARIFNAGQTCTAAKRFIVMADCYQGFVDRFTEKMAAIEPGDPLDPATVMGPLSSEAAARGLLAQIHDAVEKGATLRAGGHRVDGPGAFVEATVLTEVTPDMRAFSEELFGPAAVIYKVDGVEEAISLANNSPYGLGSAIFSADEDLAKSVAARLEYGMVSINSGTISEPDLPFGGVKRSGFGRELGRAGMEEFVNKKLVRTPAH